MAADGPAAANDSWPPARGPRYDAFVVRLWREAATGRVLRAEVEHVGSGARARAAGVPTGWVLGQIRARLADAPPADEIAAAAGLDASEVPGRSEVPPPQTGRPRGPRREGDGDGRSAV